VKQVDEILSLYKQRVNFYGPLQSKMKMIQQAYNGQFQVPLPDMEENALPSVPNLLASGVDQMSGRITSVTPSVTFSSMKPGTRMYDRRAQAAGRSITGWWQLDQVPMKMKQRGRHLIAYGMSPVVIRWDQRKQQPAWQVRHPMETFPSTDIVPGKVTPTDCLFAYRRSAGWMRSMGWGDAITSLMGRTDVPPDASILLMEFIDADSTQLIAAGYRSADPYTAPFDVQMGGNAMRGVQLEAYPNLADQCPVIVPMRITLDTATGQFDNMLGMYYQQAKLMALEVIAVEKGIFPDTYLVSRPGEVGRFLDGPHDGRTGAVNIIAGGDIREIQSQPGYLTNPTIDRLERNQRVTAGIPAEFGGESSTNIRTGRRGDAVLSAVIDFPVAEAQETFAYSLMMENQVAMGLSKQWAGDIPKTIYVGTGNAMAPVTYTPNETFENTEHVVSYPAAGSDVNSLIIGIGQRIGLGIMSKQTAATLDPYIDNPEVEHDRIIAEGLEQALVASIQQQAASGQLPPLVLSKVMKLVKDDKLEVADALTKVTEEAAKATQVEQAPEEMAAAAAMGSLAGGAPPPIAGPSPSQTNLMSLLSTLRRPSSAMGGV
jgi:hypothetical protein